ncbi:hypothetical protein Poly30_17750 [Planctomycetes bacterium Poly30]|uniref:Uncharacterized protein n=1 Tax=Saltatorellus ferox TaxID=2528018 RepID=A0A518EQ96_9BACT|nr:hypothetical protein Poly30_17750 [Planctomycetes bacterium Poly30]
MDFLLECIGFSPAIGEEDLVDIVRTRGEAAAWRGDPADHRTLSLGSGLELRADRAPDRSFWTLTPHFKVPHRLRLAVTSIVRQPDSPFDALLSGWASPPIGPAEDDEPGGAYRLSTWITDARRLGSRVSPGHVLAVSVAGFAVHVERVIANEEVEPASILDRPAGAYIRPLGSPDEPGGCCDVSLRIREIRRIQNELTSEPVEIAICDAPDRPLLLFLSPWQLHCDGHPPPQPGMRIEGTFMFTGRIAGGLPKRRSK